MISILRPVTHTGTVCKPQTASFRLFLGDLQSLPAPDPLHTLVVHMPALRLKQRCDTTVTVTTILTRQSGNPFREL